MKKNINSLLRIIFVGILFTSQLTFGQSNNPNSMNVITTAVPFLRVSPDARSGGMGELGIATEADANAVFLNLSKIPFTKSKTSIGVNYASWLRNIGVNDVYMASIAGYYKIDEIQAFSSSLRYFNLGSVPFTDNEGNDLKTSKPREFAIDFGYSRKLSQNLALGLAIRYINSNLANGTSSNGNYYKAGNAIAADLSIFHDGTEGKKNGSGLNWGLALTNLGTKISYSNDAFQKDYIPANIGIGMAYIKVFDEDNKLTVGIDLNKLLVPTPPQQGDSSGMVNYYNKSVVNSWFSSFGNKAGGFSETLKEFQVSSGAEFLYKDKFAIRAGYFYENAQKGNRKYFTVGAGLNYNMFGLNFAYLIPSGSGVNQSPLSNTIRFGILFNLQKVK